MRKLRKLISYVLCLSLTIIPFAGIVPVKGESKEGQVTISGNIFYYINENGDNNSKVIKNILNNYPITLYYEDSNHKAHSVKLTTDVNGDYSTMLKDKNGIKNTWVEIYSANNACIVSGSPKSKVQNYAPYIFTSKKKRISNNTTSYHMNISINNPISKGAINIARVINNTRNLTSSILNINIEPIIVSWTPGRGQNSQVFANKLFGFMELSGADYDERDESVIAHEYGHWVFGTIRNTGWFMWGKHNSKDEYDSRLTYSEGLATFFGQTMLGKEYYIDGTTSGAYMSSLETIPYNPNIKNGEKNENYVSAVLWDTADKGIESWDNVEEDISKIFNTNIDVIRDAEINFLDSGDPLHTFGVYQCDIEDFYHKYIDNHITKNTEKALHFWTIFNENLMQFDSETPTIDLADNKAVYKVDDNLTSISIKLYDNVKVSKVSFSINGITAGTYTAPNDNFIYTIPKYLLKKGVNKLTIKAYDYAKNYVSQDASLAVSFPAKDIFRASIGDNNNFNYNQVTYRTPYSTKYIDLVVEEEEVSTFSSPLLLFRQIEEQEPAYSEVVQEMAMTYGLNHYDTISGTLNESETSLMHSFISENGKDFALLSDDTLGDYEITMISPSGKQYINTSIIEPIPEESVSEIQTVLNMGSSGFMVFHPEPGVWNYSIRNLGTESNYYIGIYEKLSAPVIVNEKELLQIQDGNEAKMQLSVVTGSAIRVTLTGEKSGMQVTDIIHKDPLQSNTLISYQFNPLPDDTYKIELYMEDNGNQVSWTKEAEMIIDSSVPEIIMGEDYEFYTYPSSTLLQGTAINASQVSVYVNGNEIMVYTDRKENLTFGTPWLDLNVGYNSILIVAKNKAGKTISKELTLYSTTEEDCFRPEHQPIIESVLFNEKEDPIIEDNTNIKVRLSDSNTDNYKVYAIYNEEKYDFIPENGAFTLNFNPTESSGNYFLTIYAESRWWMQDSKEIEIILAKDDGEIYIIKQPEDITILEGETALLNLSEFIGGTGYDIQANIGTVQNGNWSYSPLLPGTYEVNLQIIKNEEIWDLEFYVIANKSVGFQLNLDANGGTLSNNKKYVYYDQKYGTLPTPTRTGYVFEGWYTKKEGGSKITTDTIVGEMDARILYARWKGTNVVVNLNANGGTVDQSKLNAIYGDPYGKLPTPYRDNHFFDGWYTSSTGGSAIQEETLVTTTSTHTLYARWTSKAYSITLNANGGSGTPAAKQVIHGTTYGTLPSPVRTGYTFDGWYTEIEGSEKINENSEVTKKTTHTLYARWNPIRYRILFNSNGGEIFDTSKEVVYGTTYGNLPIPTQNNYRFIGWYTLPTGGTEVTESSIVTITSSTMLYARWSGVSVHVNFDPTEGIVPIETKVVSYGDRYGTLPVPQRTGYIFDGWYSKKEGGLKVTDSVRVNELKEHSLYAHWTKQYYNLTYNLNGGGGSVSTQLIAKNLPYGAFPHVSKAGHSFHGWFTSLSEDSEQVLSGDIVKNSGDQILYAHWNPNQYTIWLNGNGAKLSKDSIQITYGSTYEALPIPTYENYTFMGWYTLPAGGYLINPAQSFTYGNDITLYAIWHGNSHTVFLDADGGTISKNEITVQYGSTYNLATPIKTGYTFVGWFTSRTGNEMILNNTTATLTSDQTFYARWKVITPQVTFNALYESLIVNGEKVSFYSRNIAYGEKYSPLLTPQRDGYTFVGWYTDPNVGTLLNSDTINMKTSAHTIYARWSANSYNLNFALENNNIIWDSKTVTYGNTYGTLPTPTKAYYTFSGWYTKPEGGDLIAANSVVKVLATQTLYARWTGMGLKVNFNGNGGSPENSSQTVYYNGTYSSLPVPSRIGYNFEGWYTSTTGGTKITTGNKVVSTGEHTLYARWSLSDITITLDYQNETNQSSSKIVHYGQEVGYLPTPTKAGYQFSGWYTSNNTLITSSSIVNTTSGYKLLARWIGNDYMVYYDANGGNVAKSSDIATNGSSYYYLLPTPTRSGYTFGGWHTKRSGGMLISSGTIVDLRSSITLYAHWTQDVYVINFYLNGGTMPYSRTSVNIGEVYSDFPVPTRIGYNFEGWYNSGLTTRIYYTTAQNNLYAKWQPQNYVMTFNGNGGTVFPASKNVTYATNYGELPVPTREGHTFLGWYPTKDGGTKATSNTVVSNTDNFTLYALWGKMTVTVSYDTNGGNPITSTKSVIYDSPYGTLPTPSRTGYTFDGWFTSNRNGKLVNAASIVESAQNHTLYAQWSPLEVSINLVSNGGRIIENGLKVATTSIIRIYGKEYGVLPVPTREGYIFKGWFTSTSGTDKIEAQREVLTQTTHSLYAQWTGITSEVTFEAAGGILPLNVTTLNVTYGSTYGALPTPTKEGHGFGGWYTEEIGGTAISQNTIVNTIDSQVLYARWNRLSYYLTFNGNGGKMTVGKTQVSTLNLTAAYNSMYGVLPVPVQSGYHFVGWFTAQEEGEEIFFSTKMKHTTGQTFYARWKPIAYDILFSSYGNPIREKKKRLFNSTVGALPTAERAYHTFKGWFTSRTGGTQVTDNTFLPSNSTYTLHAQWIPDNFNVYLDANGGNVSVESIIVPYGGLYGNLPTPVHDKYAFAGWSTDAENGRRISSTSVLEHPHDTKIYAQWQPRSYTLTFNGNGGSVSPASKAVTNNENYGVLPTPTLTGFQFEGWYTTQDSGTLVSSTDIVNLSGPQTLYAHWKPKEVTIIFDANGGKVDNAFKRIVYKNTFGVLPIPSLSNYNFDGWYTAKSGGSKIIESSSSAATDYQIVYARWIANTYLIEFDANGGTVSTPNKSVQYELTYGTLPTPSKAGCTFLGWFTDLDEGILITSSSLVKINSSQKVYARWRQN